MAVYKEEKTGTWRVIYRYTDWTGERKQTQKRGSTLPIAMHTCFPQGKRKWQTSWTWNEKRTKRVTKKS